MLESFYFYFYFLFFCVFCERVFEFSLSTGFSLFLFVWCQWFPSFLIFSVFIGRADRTENGAGRAATPLPYTGVGTLDSPKPRSSMTTSSRTLRAFSLQFFVLSLTRLPVYIRYCSTTHLACFAVHCRLYDLAGLVVYSATQCLGSPVVRWVSVFSFRFFMFISLRRDTLAPPMGLVFCVTLSFGNRLFAPVEYKLRRAAWKKIASAYSRLSECHRHTSRCALTLQ